MSEGRKRNIVDKELCLAYREGCQKTIDARFDAVLSKMEVQGTALLALSTKVSQLETNAIPHLGAELQEIRKLRKDPLGRREKGAIVVALIAGATSVLIEVLRMLL